jgi:hypothetical protein
VLSLPPLALAAADAWLPGPWRWEGARAGVLAIAALVATSAFAVSGPAAVAFAFERDRDTLDSLAISPVRARDLVLGKLLAVLAGSFAQKALLLPMLAAAFAIGGFDLGFLPRFLAFLIAADLSFASLALALGARPIRTPKRAHVLFKIVPSQAQLAVQRALAIPLLASLLPIYAIPILIPFALQNGPRLARVLDALAPLGAIHPLLALLVWGDARIFGVRVPVWGLGVAFHVLAALPLLASAAEAHREPGAPPGRATRATGLLLVAFVFVVLAGIASSIDPQVRPLVLGVIALAVVVVGAIQAGSTAPPREPFGLREVLVPFVRVDRALESSPSSAGAFGLALGLVILPCFASCEPGAPAVRLGLALALVATSLGLAFARRAAREQALEAAAVERALATPPQTGDADGSSDPRDAQNGDASSVVALLAAALLVLPVVGLGGILLARGPFPALEPVVPVLRVIAGAGIAANPLSALLPAFDPSVMTNGDPLGPLWTVVGAERTTLFGCHVAIWSAIALASLITLRRARDPASILSAALAREAAGEKPSA